MKDQIVVVGLGRFGAAVAEALVQSGHEVMALDADMAVVQRFVSTLPNVVQADSTDLDTLQRLGVAEFDVAIVAIGENLEDSILTTLLMKRVGIERVIAKARSETHGDILNRVGADRVVYPERDTALRLAHSWATQAITDSLEVIEGYTIGRTTVPDRLVGKTLQEADIVRRYGVSLLGLARGSKVMLNPSRDEVLQANDLLVLGGESTKLERLFT